MAMKNKDKENNNPSIKFREKKTKSNIRLGTKAIMFFVIAGISGAVCSNLMIKYKFENIAKDMTKYNINEEMVILDYTNVAEQISQSLVSISSEPNIQSNEAENTLNVTGVILDEEGTILTTYSGLKDRNNIYVKLPYQGSKIIKAEFIGGDAKTDAALISIVTDDKLKPAKLASMANTKEGQGIALISKPTSDGHVGSVLPGIITSRDNTLNTNGYKIMQISAPISEKNDGGAICNSKGELIGIASNKITKEKNEDKMYYAIDLRELEGIITTTTKFKHTLGLSGGNIIKDNNSDIQGFYVKSVQKGGLADKAGIGPTDIITTIDGIDIVNSEAIKELFKIKGKGEQISLEVIRDGKEKEIEIELVLD